MPKQVTLTKTQCTDGVGRDLALLLSNIASDGAVTYDELETLVAFLNDHAHSELPSVIFLRDVILKACEDGNVTSDEMLLIQFSIERVLPKELKRSIVPIGQLATRQLQGPATERQLEYILALGGMPPNELSKQEASDMIESLKAIPAPSPRQIMFLRFWGREDLMLCSRDEVTEWMSSFIDEDERRRQAWNLFKQEIGDDGSHRDPSAIPVGIGETYLTKCSKRRWF